MMKMTKRTSLVGMLLAASGFGLMAQQTEGFKAGVALPYQLDSVRKYTHQSLMGLSVDGAYQGSIYGGAAYYRGGLGVNWLPGKTQNDVKISLTSIQVYGDFVVPVGSSKRFAVITGISANNWSKSVSVPDGNGDSGGVKNSFGKLGVRAGLEYSFNSRLAVSALLQVTELGTDSEFVKGADKTMGSDKVNPSWIQIGVHYSF